MTRARKKNVRQVMSPSQYGQALNKRLLQESIKTHGPRQVASISLSVKQET